LNLCLFIHFAVEIDFARGRAICLQSLMVFLLTLWRPLLPHEYSSKASCSRTG